MSLVGARRWTHGCRLWLRFRVALRTVVEEAAPPTKPYEQFRTTSHWQSQNTHCYTALRKFRRFYAKNSLGTFQVLKDGANYEGMSLYVEQLRSSLPEHPYWCYTIGIVSPFAFRVFSSKAESILTPRIDRCYSNLL